MRESDDPVIADCHRPDVDSSVEQVSRITLDGC